MRKESRTRAESKDSEDWKVEWPSNSRADCGTIHPETMGQKSTSVGLRVSSNSSAKKKIRSSCSDRTCSESLAGDSEWWVIPNSMAYGGHLMRENKQVPKC